jgi:tRNA U34 2-thiouridine synthase MnmA/TrmU
MLSQGVDVVAVNFVSPFCTCSPRREGSCHLASAIARELKVPIRVLSKGIDYLRIVERPRFGHGRGLNPCLDCRIYMLKQAASLMETEQAQFIVTGEVLGQRPMSQHRAALDLIERESGLMGRILRPLSAQWLPPTIPEQNGWVDRAKLMAIRGRSRSEQLALAKQEGVELFGCAAGGCLLTDPVVARRLKDVFCFCPDYDLHDAKLATFGRHFRLHPGLKVILGRNQTENDRLQQIGVPWPRLEIADAPGPLMLIRGTMCDGAKRPLAWLLRHFAPKVTTETVSFRWTCGERRENWSFSGKATDEEVNRSRI